MVLKQPPSAGLRWLVLSLPLAGSLSLPVLVPLVISRWGIGSGVLLTLVVSCLWFALMLRFAEMPEHG
jgi:hypothetical protein